MMHPTYGVLTTTADGRATCVHFWMYWLDHDKIINHGLDNVSPCIQLGEQGGSLDFCRDMNHLRLRGIF